MSVKSFAFTVRKNVAKELVSQLVESDYEVILDLMRKAGTIKALYFERSGSLTHLHAHGVIELPKGYKYKQLCIKPFNCKFEPIYDLEKWMQYITKDVNLFKTIKNVVKLCTSKCQVSRTPSPTEGDEYDEDIDFKMPTQKLF